MSAKSGNREFLFYLKPHTANIGGWHIDIQEQLMTPGAVYPVDPDDPACTQTLCELHSHNTMRAFFSATDDGEESFGFRIYAVIGRVDTAPEIRVRISEDIESVRKTAQHGAVVVTDYHKRFGRTGVIVSVSRWRGSVYYTIALDTPNVSQMELPASDVKIL